MPVLAQSPQGQGTSATNLKGFMMVGPYAGYTLGFGDRFEDFDYSGGSTSLDAGISFGGSFFYGLSDKIMLGGELMFQQYKVSTETDFDFTFATNPTPGDYFTNNLLKTSEVQQEFSDSEMKISFLASMLYAFSYMQTSMIMGNVGLGLYDHGTSDVGLFAGIMYQRLISNTLSLFVLPRVHYVFADASMFMVQVVVGLHFWLGQTGAPMSR